MGTPKSSGGFEVFLETLNARPPGQGGSAPALPGPSKTASVTLLNLLPKEANVEVPVRQVMAESGMDITEFASALVALREADIITLAGVGGEQVLALTPIGATMRSLV
jgi:hypothetical protein